VIESILSERLKAGLSAGVARYTSGVKFIYSDTPLVTSPGTVEVPGTRTPSVDTASLREPRTLVRLSERAKSAPFTVSGLAWHSE
jgi:hypothetical protein